MMTIEDFLKLAPEKLSWLVDKGFARKQAFEEISTALATLVYCGDNVAFEFSLDIRDQCVDAQVIQVKDGQLSRNWDGGYSSGIYNYLIKHEGYRGSPSGVLKEKPDNTSEMEFALEQWISLLDTAGSRLLSDAPLVIKR